MLANVAARVTLTERRLLAVTVSNPVPVILIAVPARAIVGVKLVIDGAAGVEMT